MTITIRLSTRNEAFSDDKHGEITRILREWLDRGGNSQSLRDYNGNTVGTVAVTGK